MIRLFIFLLVVFAFGLGFTWLADRPGELTMVFAGQQYRVSLMVAAVAVVAVVAAVMLGWWVLKGLWNSPYTVSRYFRVRRRDRGYQALSTGLIAAGSGDAARARAMRKQAVKLISSDQEPLVFLLDAQTAMLEGDYSGAHKKFEAMLDDPEMRLLGLRGLYLEAERQGDHAAARHFAGRAAAMAPQLTWAADATLEEKVQNGDWDSALAIVDAQKSAKQIDRDVAHRRKAVMLTGKAMALFDSQFDLAKATAIEANRLLPDFVPAAVLAARAYFRNDELRRGSKILEHVWKRSPHPEVAQAYVFARPGNSTHDRLRRAQKLQTLRSNNVESALAVARAALDAREFMLAREQAESALRLEPRESVYLLLADIEEADVRNQGRIREYLAKAVRAPRDPAWVADNTVFNEWAPISPISGRFDVFEWKTPVERAAPVIESHDDEKRDADQDFASVALPVPMQSEPDTQIEDAELLTEPAPEPSEQQAATETVEETAKPQSPSAPLDETEPAVTNGNGKQNAVAVEKVDEAPEPVKDADEDRLARLPDDPGVDENEKKDAARFRLF